MEVHTKYCLAPESRYTDRKNSSTSEESSQFAWLSKQRTGAAYVLTCHKTEHMAAVGIFKDKQQKQIIYPAIHMHITLQEPQMLHLTIKFR